MGGGISPPPPPQFLTIYIDMGVRSKLTYIQLDLKNESLSPPPHVESCIKP